MTSITAMLLLLEAEDTYLTYNSAVLNIDMWPQLTLHLTVGVPQVTRLAEENHKLEQTIRHMIQDIESRTVSMTVF